jgi:hydrogenase maturation protease
VTAPVLVFGYGNPSRGDDALGPEFARRLAERFEQEIARGELEVLTDYQLQVEHALDLRGRDRIFFVDACTDGADVELRPVAVQRDASFTSHLLSPSALLHTFAEIERAKPPRAWVLAIRGEQFELGSPMSETAERNLGVALAEFQRGWQ